MDFGIIGTGAMGGVFGAHLAANGETVRCFDIDTDIIETIQTEGLRVERPGRTDLRTHPEASTNPTALGVVDVAFVFTKTIDTITALEDAAPMLDESTRVVTVQNGLGNVERVAREVRDDRVLGGYTRAGANTVEPGRVRQLTQGETVVGGDDVEFAERIVRRLSAAGLESEAVRDPEPYIWDKAWTNVAVKPVAALSELRNGPMIEIEETRAAMTTLIEEAIAVARAKGVEILADDPVSLVVDRELDAAGQEKKSSILEDIEAGRPTEIQHINGAVADLGDEFDIATPYNRLATQLVKGKERSYLD
ncbi:MAG: ketopantoate reductase family protein [Salinirussus sp.]